MRGKDKVCGWEDHLGGNGKIPGEKEEGPHSDREASLRGWTCSVFRTELTVSRTDCVWGMRVKEEPRLDLRTCAWDRRRGHRTPSFPAGLPRRGDQGSWATLMPNSWVPGARDIEPHLAADWMMSLTLGCKLKPGTKTPARVFPGGPVVETPCFQCRGCEFDP